MTTYKCNINPHLPTMHNAHVIYDKYRLVEVPTRIVDYILVHKQMLCYLLTYITSIITDKSCEFILKTVNTTTA